MLGKAFRPCRQLPDKTFAALAVHLCATGRWGETGAGCARSVADTLRCAERTALCLCFRRAWRERDQHAHVLSLYAAASSKFVGDGALDVPQYKIKVFHKVRTRNFIFSFPIGEVFCQAFFQKSVTRNNFQIIKKKRLSY